MRDEIRERCTKQKKKNKKISFTPCGLKKKIEKEEGE